MKRGRCMSSAWLSRDEIHDHVRYVRGCLKAQSEDIV